MLDHKAISPDTGVMSGSDSDLFGVLFSSFMGRGGDDRDGAMTRQLGSLAELDTP